MVDNNFELTGKSLVFTDLHIGLKNSHTTYLNICAMAIKEIILAIKKNNVSNVIFCGDLFHSRKQLDINAINYGLKLIDAIAKYAKIYLICGNHDIYYKNTANVNSINMFKNNKNVVVIDSLTGATINGQKALFIPWLADISSEKPETYDLIFGHFDVSNKYLIASYIENHTKNTESSEELVNRILADDLLLSETDDSKENISDEIDEIILKKTKSGDLIGNFVDIVKKMGVVYSGHIHNHDEFIAKDRQFIFVGSPYQQTFAEIDSKDGYYILDENNNRRFYEIKNIPHRMKISVKEIMDVGINDYDFSKVKGNIVKKIFDVNISKADEISICQKIVDNHPLEEELSEYDVQFTSSLTNNEITNETLDLIKKSKLEYIKSYVDNIDDKTLEQNKLTKEKIYELLEFYYNKVTENMEASVK